MLPFSVSSCGLTAGNNSTESSAGVLLESAAKLPEPFKVPLPVPPILEPVRSDAATDYYEITQKVGQAGILPGLKTEVWGYNGIFPGPTIESRRGKQTIVQHRNELDVPTVVHLHGGKTPPEYDGYPTDMILPVGGGSEHHSDPRAPEWHGKHSGTMSEGTKEYAYPIDQPATTLWYHDHRMDFTGPRYTRDSPGSTSSEMTRRKRYRYPRRSATSR